MTIAPRLLARVVLPKVGDAYTGACPLFGFAYHLTVRKHAAGIEIEAWDGPPVGLYRIPVLDDPAAAPVRRVREPVARAWVEVPE